MASSAKSAAASRQDGRTPRPLREFVNRADFHAAGSAAAAGGNLGSPLDGFIEVGAVENVVTGQLFFGFGKRPVGHERSPVLKANCRRSGSVLQRIGCPKNSAPLRLLLYGDVSGKDLGHLFG